MDLPRNESWSLSLFAGEVCCQFSCSAKLRSSYLSRVMGKLFSKCQCQVQLTYKKRWICEPVSLSTSLKFLICTVVIISVVNYIEWLMKAQRLLYELKHEIFCSVLYHYHKTGFIHKWVSKLSKNQSLVISHKVTTLTVSTPFHYLLSKHH